jgi:hypothetical protein
LRELICCYLLQLYVVWFTAINGGNKDAKMNFVEATDVLFAHVRQEELAAAMGISVASIRQARLSRESKAYRTPPVGWEKAVIKLAEQHSKELAVLAKKLRSGI